MEEIFYRISLEFPSNFKQLALKFPSKFVEIKVALNINLILFIWQNNCIDFYSFDFTFILHGDMN